MSSSLRNPLVVCHMRSPLTDLIFFKSPHPLSFLPLSFLMIGRFFLYLENESAKKGKKRTLEDWVISQTSKNSLFLFFLSLIFFQLWKRSSSVWLMVMPLLLVTTKVSLHVPCHTPFDCLRWRLRSSSAARGSSWVCSWQDCTLFTHFLLSLTFFLPIDSHVTAVGICPSSSLHSSFWGKTKAWKAWGVARLSICTTSHRPFCPCLLLIWRWLGSQ